MADRFALPCPSCAAVNEVGLRQAGESIACRACHATIEVPTMRGLRQLQPAVTEPRGSIAPVAGSFVLARGVFVIGLVVLLGGLAAGAGTWYSASHLRTDPPQAEIDKLNAAFFAKIDSESLPEFWKTWQEDVIGRPPGKWRESSFAANRATARARRLTGSICFGAAALGLATMIGSAFIRR